ncbi:hypothetical protein ABZ504_38570 [Streptomyces mirabilis]|uniref:hypothetical protein n=1 Tax=Streptomyces mirabilis TaxID=68239 RepID=UPI0033F85485
MISDTAGLASAARKRLSRACTDWDVIRVVRFLALRAIENIGHPGAITVDPHPAAPALYFLVPAGAIADWRMPQTTAFGQPMRVALPPDRKETPPGPYWLIQRSQGLTEVGELRQALEAASRPTVAQAPGGRGTRRTNVLLHTMLGAIPSEDKSDERIRNPQVARSRPLRNRHERRCVAMSTAAQVGLAGWDGGT